MKNVCVVVVGDDEYFGAASVCFGEAVCLFLLKYATLYDCCLC